MNRKLFIGKLLIGKLFVALGLLGAADSPFAASFPENKLPDYIERITDFGERADWSIDGSRILFLNRSGGDIFEVEVETKKVSPIFKAPDGMGCWRAMYLSNGDYFFTMGKKSGGQKTRYGRDVAYAYILDSKLKGPPTRINTIINEGAAISRKRLKIAYTSDMEHIYTADIVYKNGVPSFANKKEIVDNDDVRLNGKKVKTGEVEPQNFVPPEETKLIMAAYGLNGSDALVYDMEEDEFRDLTNGNNDCDKEPFDEPEGVFPNGKYTLVESNRHVCGDGIKKIEIYRFNLSDEKWKRLTYFSNVKGFKATNPVVRDNGKYFAFQEGHSDGQAGQGFGIYVYDLVAAGEQRMTPSAVQLGTEGQMEKRGAGSRVGPGGALIPADMGSKSFNAAGQALSAKPVP